MEIDGIEVQRDEGKGVLVRDQDFVISVNPAGIEVETDLVLLTSSGKAELEKISEICHPRTCVVVPGDLEEEKVPCRDTESMDGDRLIDIYGIKIQGFPVEDVRENCSDLSYFVEMADEKFYVAGENKVYSGLRKIEKIVDIAFLPFEQGDSIKDIVDLAVKIKPDKIVPYLVEGTDRSDLYALKAELEDRSIECVIGPAT